MDSNFVCRVCFNSHVIVKNKPWICSVPCVCNHFISCDENIFSVIN